ncbi:LOW QUALITY PROTEIN: hypothetical protein Cgig2_002506 [Carnegiea gigantea]|uniref:NAC domain-containing protein n=1 Tax=Carnegiea gigantea TaxID=171969 RepID=A0A9Q1KTF5_9CARY|nr:LOW QUALITY PROTEIN: hypothetical protein Cgig2_002506 [Carnegiea gigantea]
MKELVDYYLRKKVAERLISVSIKDVDLYNIENVIFKEMKNSMIWYFFSTKIEVSNRNSGPTELPKQDSGKLQGETRPIYLRHRPNWHEKNLLVFYQGRGYQMCQKSDWIMHGVPLRKQMKMLPPRQEEGWVVCRVFKKRMSTIGKLGDDSPCWYNDQVSFMSDIDSPRRIPIHLNYHASSNFHHHNIYPYNIPHNDPFLQLPPLESPKIPQSSMSSTSTMPYGHNGNLRHLPLNQDQIIHSQPLDSAYGSNIESNLVPDQVTDWRVLDKFVASQLSQDDHGPSRKESNYSNAPVFLVSEHTSTAVNPTSNQQEEMKARMEYASTSTSSSQIDLWK